MTLYKIDSETGMYIKPVIVGEMTAEEIAALGPMFISTPIPPDMLSPRWDNVQWVETYVPEPSRTEEIISMSPTSEERISALESAMLEMILGGGV